MANALGIVWAKLIHDLTLYEREFTLRDVQHVHFSRPEEETPEEREERLRTEIAGGSAETL